MEQGANIWLCNQIAWQDHRRREGKLTGKMHYQRRDLHLKVKRKFEESKEEKKRAKYKDFRNFEELENVLGKTI